MLLNHVALYCAFKADSIKPYGFIVCWHYIYIYRRLLQSGRTASGKKLVAIGFKSSGPKFLPLIFFRLAAHGGAHHVRPPTPSRTGSRIETALYIYIYIINRINHKINKTIWEISRISISSIFFSKMSSERKN